MLFHTNEIKFFFTLGEAGRQEGGDEDGGGKDRHGDGKDRQGGGKDRHGDGKGRREGARQRRLACLHPLADLLLQIRIFESFSFQICSALLLILFRTLDGI